MAQQELCDYHKHFRDAALGEFSSTRKMGGEDYSQTFLKKLDEELEVSILISCFYDSLLKNLFDGYAKVNESKNLFKSMRTPSVLLVLLIIDYIFQEVRKTPFKKAHAKRNAF